MNFSIRLPNSDDDVLCYFEQDGKIICRVGHFDTSLKRWLIHSDGRDRYYLPETVVAWEQVPTMQNIEVIGFEIQSVNPKPDAKSYYIGTMQDVFNAVTSKNIEQFLKEFETVLRSGLLLKAIHDANIESGLYSAENAADIEFPGFVFIED